MCRVDDVPLGEGRNVTVGASRIAVFRTDAGWYALVAACPHLGGPLADGIVAASSVTCPLHERRFDLLSGAAIGHDGCAVRAHVVDVRDGQVFVTPAAG